MSENRSGMRRLLAPAALCCAAFGPDLERFEYRRVAMGVKARLLLYAPDERAAQEAAAAAFKRLDKLDATFSDYALDSELNALCSASGKGSKEVSADLCDLLLLSREIAEASGGAFDPTVGPLTRLWRRARAEGRLPTSEELELACGRCGYENLLVDAEARRVAFARENMQLDLGAIAKGYACDELGRLLRERGLDVFLIELGGDLVAGSPPPGKRGWQVGCVCCSIRTRNLILKDGAIATSGDTEQFLELDGVRYAHVLDPRTGQFLQTPGCVSVLAGRGAIADALATAAYVLGPGQSGPLLARYGATIWQDNSDPLHPQGADERPLEQGFDKLFDGKTLEGWTNRGGAFDGDARWSVEAGCIVGRTSESGAGGLLYTNGTYASFELSLEFQLDEPFDSGIFLRTNRGGEGVEYPGFQITLDNRPDGEIGAVYSGGFLQHNEGGAEHLRRNAWNDLLIRCTGFDLRVETVLNGAKITDYSMEPRSVSSPQAASGRIGLQVHETGPDTSLRAARFRNIALKRLPMFAGEGFVDRTSGDIDPGKAALERGWRHLLAAGTSMQLGGYRTAEDYEDFHLRLDFRGEPIDTLRVVLRGDRKNPACSGYELRLPPEPEQPGMLPPEEGWSTLEASLRGPRLQAAVNGTPFCDIDLSAIPAGDPSCATRAEKGFIGLHAEGVSIRNALLRPL